MTSRQAELRADLRRNVPAHAQRALREYVRWLHRGEGRAKRLCEAGVPLEVAAGGLSADTMPQPGTLVNSHVGFYLRTGKHAMTADDWKIFLDYADKQFGHR